MSTLEWATTTRKKMGSGHLKARSPAPFQSNRLFSVFHLFFLKSFLTFKQNYLTAKVPFSISFLDSHALFPSFSLSSWYFWVTPFLYFFPSHLCKVTPLPCLVITSQIKAYLKMTAIKLIWHFISSLAFTFLSLSIQEDSVIFLSSCYHVW